MRHHTPSPGKLGGLAREPFLHQPLFADDGATSEVEVGFAVLALRGRDPADIDGDLFVQEGADLVFSQRGVAQEVDPVDGKVPSRLIAHVDDLEPGFLEGVAFASGDAGSGATLDASLQDTHGMLLLW